MDTEYDDLAEDAYLLIENDHCYIVMNPNNERSH